MPDMNRTVPRRRYRPLDRLLIELDHGARTLLAKPVAARDYPAEAAGDEALSPNERRLASRLMRVNHAGEVSAQALYRGHAAVARSDTARDRMLAAADEEQDHLAWCARRLEELGGRRSRLDGLWYAGSFAIGALAGIGGDRYGLGFVAETEKQVERHLDRHLARLPTEDVRSRQILETMQADEIRHGRSATQAGARALPRPVKRAMAWVSRVMTGTAFWI